MRRARHGIVLVISIVLAVVMVMFVGAAINLGVGSLGAGQLGRYQLDAERAAQSGVEYCLTQLKADPTWRGDLNLVTVNRPDLVVREDEGNIVGLLRGQDGSWSQFRCRFNYQDGPGGGDGFAGDPAFTIDHPYVSVNNLQGPVPIDLPRADGPAYSVTPTSAVAFQVPTWSVSLAVEGRAGLRQVDPGTPEVLFPAAAQGRVVEAVYQIAGAAGAVVEEAGSMAGQDFTVDLGTGGGQVLVTSASPDTPRIRAKGEASVTGGANPNYLSPDGEVRTLANPTPTLDAAYDSGQVAVVEEPAYDPFYQLTWSQVRQAAPGNGLPGGTYVWWDNGTLHYYDMAYSDYVTYMQDPANVNDPGVEPAPLPPVVQLEDVGGVKTLVVTGDVQVEPSVSGEDSLAVIPRMGAEEAPPGDPEGDGGGDLAASAATTLTASTGTGGLYHQFLLLYQGPSGEIDIETNTNGSDFAEVQWSGSSISFSLTNGATAEDLMHKIWDTSYGGPDWQWDGTANQNYGSSQYAPVAFDPAAAASFFGITGGGPPAGAVDPPGVSDALTASEVALKFDPPDASSAVISAPGDIRLTGSVAGEGGSLVSGGSIRVTGLGASFAGQDNPVNMYAVGDIYFSTLDETGQGEYAYADINLKGIVYTQGDFIARLGSPELPDAWGNLNLEGTLIAYGGDPAGSPGANGKGAINLRAGSVNIVYSSAYTGSLFATPPPDFEVTRISWSNRF